MKEPVFRSEESIARTRKGAIEMTKAVLRQQPSFAPKLAAIILAASTTGARGDNFDHTENESMWILDHTENESVWTI